VEKSGRVMFDLATRADKLDAIAAVYVGYFNRAPDPAGLDFWVSELNAAVGRGEDPNGVLIDVANAFAASAEARDAYPLFATPTPDRADFEDFVATVFENIFNRAPDPAGLDFWADELAVRSPGQAGRIILDIISGAQGNDALTIANKVAVGRSYAEAFAQEAAEWTVEDDLAEAVAVVDAVTAAADSVSAGEEEARRLARADATFEAELSVSFDDPTAALAGVQDDIAASIEAAWDLWEARFDLTTDSSIEVEVRADRFAPEGVLASTLSIVSPSVPAALADANEPFGPVVPGAVGELITGEDSNGGQPDIIFNMPTAGVFDFAYRTDYDDPLGFRQFDALTVFTHEFGHALAMDGFINSGSTQQSLFDAQVTQQGAEDFFDDPPDDFFFVGEDAVAVHGGPVPLRPGDPFHLDLPGDLMAPSIAPGEESRISELDLAILKDSGVPIADDVLIA